MASPIRTCMLAAALAAGASSAFGVITYATLGGARSITLRVGSNDAAVNSVTFTVNNATLAPTGGAVTGVPGAGAPPTTPSGGILVEVTTRRRGGAPDVVRLTANSSTGLACQSGTCLGSGVTIPFSTISWTSYEPGGGSFSAGIPSGAFTGAANQTLFTHTIPGGSGNSMTASNVLIFTYDNATLYPSGVYSGRVTYTATVP